LEKNKNKGKNKMGNDAKCFTPFLGIAGFILSAIVAH
jgi:hypothetical protein